MTPFAICTTTACFSRSRYPGKIRDTNSGLDYFGARFYESSMGRFMSPDWSEKVEPVPYAKLADPQSLNLYAYVRNNPLGGIDADGHDYGQMEAQYAEGNSSDPNFVGESQNQHAYIQSAMQSVYDGARQQNAISLPETAPDLSIFNSQRPTVVYSPDPALDGTAITALQGINPTSISEDREYASRGYKNPDGTYGIMPFNPGTQAGSTPPPISALPPGTTNAARLHTHGGNDPGYDNEHFSPQDMRNARHDQVPSYLATPHGSIQRYDPINDRVTILVPGSN